jgi:hypothetical protein
MVATVPERTPKLMTRTTTRPTGHRPCYSTIISSDIVEHMSYQLNVDESFILALYISAVLWRRGSHEFMA